MNQFRVFRESGRGCCLKMVVSVWEVVEEELEDCGVFFEAGFCIFRSVLWSRSIEIGKCS